MMVHESKRRHWAAWILLPFAALVGCGEAGTDPSGSPPSQALDLASAFDPRTASTVRGDVTWEGDLPQVPPFDARINLSLDGLTHQRLTRANPNAPLIDPQNRKIGNAVVFLRGVDPTHARPWDHPPVQVTFQDHGCMVRQGGQSGNVGFVRRGDRLEMISRDSVFHAVHAGGAAFFSLTFPDPDQARWRRLNEKGLVELTSGAGYYWMRAYLFVDDHPYYAHTDRAGRFVLPQVPSGSYELVCWLPNWKEARHERDPETGLITRIAFGPPAERVLKVTVTAGQNPVEVHFNASERDFR